MGGTHGDALRSRTPRVAQELTARRKPTARAIAHGIASGRDPELGLRRGLSRTAVSRGSASRLGLRRARTSSHACAARAAWPWVDNRELHTLATNEPKRHARARIAACRPLICDPVFYRKPLQRRICWTKYGPPNQARSGHSHKAGGRAHTAVIPRCWVLHRLPTCRLHPLWHG